MAIGHETMSWWKRQSWNWTKLFLQPTCSNGYTLVRGWTRKICALAQKRTGSLTVFGWEKRDPSSLSSPKFITTVLCLIWVLGSEFILSIWFGNSQTTFFFFLNKNCPQIGDTKSQDSAGKNAKMFWKGDVFPTWDIKDLYSGDNKNQVRPLRTLDNWMAIYER